jgi:hypothetical protein
MRYAPVMRAIVLAAIGLALTSQTVNRGESTRHVCRACYDAGAVAVGMAGGCLCMPASAVLPSIRRSPPTIINLQRRFIDPGYRG